MPTLLTDPRSGGMKRSSGVNVLPIVKETWEEVRDDNNPINWLMAGYQGSSKSDITILGKGYGGLEECANCLPSTPVFGGLKLSSSGKFVSFFYADETIGIMKRGRASMHKNGVLNVLEGCVSEVDITPGMTEDDLLRGSSSLNAKTPSSSFDADSNQEQRSPAPVENNNELEDPTFTTTVPSSQTFQKAWKRDNFYLKSNQKSSISVVTGTATIPSSDDINEVYISPTTRKSKNYYLMSNQKSSSPIIALNASTSDDNNEVDNSASSSKSWMTNKYYLKTNQISSSPIVTTSTSDDNNDVDSFPKPWKSNIHYHKSNKQKSTSSTSSRIEPTLITCKMKSIDINAFNSHDKMTSPTTSINPKSYIAAVANNTTEQNNAIDCHYAESSTTVCRDESYPMVESYISYEELKGVSIESLPPTVDPLNREKSLSDDEFYEVFGMDKKSFYKMPCWKQTNQKKSKLLF